MEFEYLYREKLDLDVWDPEEQNWDLFLSSFNSTMRVNEVFHRVAAKRKIWLLAPEYSYGRDEWPTGDEVFNSTKGEESEFIIELFEQIGPHWDGLSICIDITGFIRHHLLFLVKYLQYSNVKRFDVIYTEPLQYKKKDETRFSSAPVSCVRPIAGFEGNHSTNNDNDLLIIGVGYDHELVKQVIEYKDYAHIATLWGFPSLRADMYQENILRASRIGDAVFTGAWHKNQFYARANDPFSTASTLRDIVNIQRKKCDISNLYLSPLSTKPQVLGFALYYLSDLLHDGASVIFPFTETYSRETSTGISSVWLYTVEL